MLVPCKPNRLAASRALLVTEATSDAIASISTAMQGARSSFKHGRPARARSSNFPVFSKRLTSFKRPAGVKGPFPLFAFSELGIYARQWSLIPRSSQQVANQFLAASGKQISRKTVARRLRDGGLYARRPVVCVPLTRQHRTPRLQWCLEHHNWTEQEWACVLFSDESRFSLSSDCRRLARLIWRESGTAYRPENIQENDRYPTCSIMVWAGIMINGHARLHVIANGTMTGQRYIDEVLLPHVRLFRGSVGDKLVFIDDNATCYRTLAVQDCLDSEGIQRLVWPARSPDLNPIKNVWYALGRQVAGQNYPPTNKNTLIRALTEEWDKLLQQLLDNVVQSMVRRVECCITLHGGHIPY
ncbi:transposable element Tcb2 transposase [Trichonephila clavipes]|nr:transposable element Tcb2 transposase [Trichonephila clavipes]